MSRKPDLERPLVALWDILNERERAELLAAGGLPEDYEPDSRQAPTRQQQLEGARELERLARMRPGIIGTWPQRLIERVEPDSEEGE